MESMENQRATPDDKKFGVVKFVGDNTVAVIHLNWVDGADCFWPAATHKNLGALTLEGAQPQPDWKKSRFASLGWYDTYQKARSKLPTAELTSDLCSDVEMGRGRRKKAKRILYSETESEGEETYQPPKPPTPPCFKPTTKSVRCRRKVPQVREKTYKPSGKRAHGSRRKSHEKLSPQHHSPTSYFSQEQTHGSHCESHGELSSRHRSPTSHFSQEWTYGNKHLSLFELFLNTTPG
ncbi:uncharacterized protein LOC121836554 [Ixodes scapularis]|uniref:uncharacterized protein LOC121836554 n=1 Tax=Ixodes scapularis TaxID=6945 RepID=UPI001C387051|nr:uncharacterized protein LOC121836554 [Ixodes scapularis]